MFQVNRDKAGVSIEAKVAGVWMFFDSAIMSLSVERNNRGFTIGLDNDKRPFFSIDKDGDIAKYYSL